MNRSDFQSIADLRLSEAKTLLDNLMFDGAYYLAGYSVECALKACICKMYLQFTWPDKKFVSDCHTHDLVTLLKNADLQIDMSQETSIQSPIATNWGVVKDWNERSRYERHTQSKAQEIYDAVAHPSEGVLQWIKARW